MLSNKKRSDIPRHNAQRKNAAFNAAFFLFTTLREKNRAMLNITRFNIKLHEI